ncbi:hypothetical protein BH11BAC7_BH11BAC7_32710 [soil metagenome]
MQTEKEVWEQCSTHAFWGEIAPCNHLLQIYENDDVVLNSLEGFVSSGFTTGESVIIIAAQEHLEALNTRLKSRNVNVAAFIANDQYIPLNANEVLAKFMVNNWPDEALFNETVRKIVFCARGNSNRPVRAYGEMVAILWGQGHSGATVQLEHLWNKFCETEIFCLFCAYPKAGFTQRAEEPIHHICSSHSKVIAGDVQSMTEVFYKSTL